MENNQAERAGITIANNTRTPNNTSGTRYTKEATNADGTTYKPNTHTIPTTTATIHTDTISATTNGICYNGGRNATVCLLKSTVPMGEVNENKT